MKVRLCGTDVQLAKPMFALYQYLVQGALRNTRLTFSFFSHGRTSIVEGSASNLNENTGMAVGLFECQKSDQSVDLSDICIPLSLWFM